MRHGSALCLLLALTACTRESPPRTGGPTVPTTERLGGRSVEEAREGPWTLRRMQVPRGGAPAEGRTWTSGDAAGPDTLSATAPAPGGRAGGFDPGAVAPPMAAPVAAAPAPGGPPAKDAGPSLESEGAPRPEDARNAAQGGPLRAGSTDDNADFEKFLAFLASWSDREDTATKHDPVDVSERRFVAVVDATGRPVPGAKLRIVDESRDAIVWAATTYGDGLAPVFPRAFPRVAPGAAALSPTGGWVVEVSSGGEHQTLRWNGASPTLTVRLAGERPVPSPLRLDVGILLDTTGSMGDEMARVKATLLEVTKKAKALGREVDLRWGAVLYKDIDAGEPYVTMRHPFTTDATAFQGALASVEAGGGGDEAESVNQGLAEAVGRLDWRPDAAKLLFLVADAPPHMDYEGDVPYGTSLLAAIAAGIRIHTVAASGLNAFGTLVFRQAAQLTRGHFVFIEYGDAASSAAAHGVAGRVASNNLDDILFRAIQAEIEGYGRPPVPAGVDATVR